MWVLKQDVHRGKGVHVMKQQDAIREVQPHSQLKHVCLLCGVTHTRTYDHNQRLL